MKKAYFFDLDDTLYDASEYYLSAFEEISGYLARTYSREKSALYQSLCDCWVRLTSRYPRLFNVFLTDMGLPLDEIPNLIRILHHHAPDLELYPDAVEVLDRLKGRARLGIVTDGNGFMQRTKVRALGLIDVFDTIVFTHDCGTAWHKPSALPFKSICSQTGVTPAEALYVGDNPHYDSIGATLVGMDSYRLCRGQYKDVPTDVGDFTGEIQLLTDLMHGEVMAARR